MKNIKFQILLVMFLIVGTISAQNLEPKVVKKMRGEKATIIVEVPPDSGVTRFKLENAKTDKSISENMTADNTVLFEVELSEKISDFNLIGYKNTEIVYTSKTSIKFIKSEPVKSGDEENSDEDTTRVKGTGNQSTDKDDEKANKLGVFVLDTEGTTATLNITADFKADGKLFSGCEKIETTNNVKEKRTVFAKCEYKIKIVGDEEKKEFKRNITIKDYSKGEPLLPQTEKVEIYKGNNTITVWVAADGKKDEIVAQAKINCTDCEKERQGLKYRAIVGFQQVGATSANSEQFPYLNFQFSAPIKVFRTKGGINRTLSACGDVNFQPTAIQTLANLSNFATTVVGSEKPNNLVQSFDFLAGLEFDLMPKSKFFGGVFDTSTSLSFTVSGGATLPLSTRNQPAFYKIPKVGGGMLMQTDPAFAALFPGTENKDNIAFVAPERDRFFRQYYAGLRLKTFFDDKNMFPATFDAMIGQNEAITNTLKGVILRLDGSTPFPIKGADFLYIFGGVQMKLSRKTNDRIPPFFLETATNISLTSSSTYIAPIDKSPFLLSDRDTFRLGIGIDLFKVFRKNDTTNAATEKEN